MRELTCADMSGVLEAEVSLRAQGADRLTIMIAGKRMRLCAFARAAEALERELRVMECFARIRVEWKTLSCRNKLRHVLRHGVAFSPGELAALLDENDHTIRSTLQRMRTRGEVARVAFGRWRADP